MLWQFKWQTRKEKEAAAQGPVAYLIYRSKLEKIISVVTMAICAILCALAVVFIPDVYQHQNSWLDKLLLTLWFIVLALSAQNIYDRYQIFKFMDLWVNDLKTKKDKWFFDILKQVIKNDKPEDDEKEDDKKDNK